MLYSASITTSGLRLRESRLIADLLLGGASEAAWNEALMQQNILQLKSPVSIQGVSRLIRARLEPLGPELWALVRDGNREVAVQAALAGAVKQSRLLGDFLNITVREQRALFAPRLQPGLWRDYLAECRGRDPDMPHWSDNTVAKLRSTVFSILAEGGYLRDTRSLLLQTVFVDDRVAVALRSRGESYVLRCLEVTA